MTPISITEKYPADNERVLIYDAAYSEWNVGWNAWRHTVGGASRPGKWILPCGDADDMQITHWLPCPQKP